MAQWTVNGSAEKFDRYSTRNATGSIKVVATALTVTVQASTAGYAYDQVVEALDAAGWRDIRLTSINLEA